mgnify:CR=1 FL=1
MNDWWLYHWPGRGRQAQTYPSSAARLPKRRDRPERVRRALVTQLPPLGLRFPAQRGYCDLCRLEYVASQKPAPTPSSPLPDQRKEGR